MQEESGVGLHDFLSSSAEPPAAPKDLTSGLPPGTIVGLDFSHPLLLMFLYGAERCCRYVSANLPTSDLIGDRQAAGNILHALIAGSRAGLQSRTRSDSLLSLLFSRLSRQELQTLCSLRGHLQLRPAELAIHWDEFRLAERLLCNGALTITAAEFHGPHAILTFETDDYDITSMTSCAVVSPLMLLISNYNLARVYAMKEANFLRKDGIVNAWTIALERRQVPLQIFSFFLILFFMGCSKQVLLKEPRLLMELCANLVSAQKHEYFFEKADLFFATIIIFFSICSIVFFYVKRRSLHLPSSLKIDAFNEISYNLFFPPLLFLIIKLAAPHVYVKMSMEDCSFVLNISTLIEFIENILLSYVVLFIARESYFFGRFLTKFFCILKEFLSFIVFYLILIFFSSECYRSANEISLFFRHGARYTSYNMSAETAFYSMFRVSLNIMETPVSDFNYVMMFIHIFFFLCVPCLFFNFIIGIISARLSLIARLEGELSLLTRAQIALFRDFAAWPLHQLLSRCRKGISFKIQVSLCDVNVRGTFDTSRASPNSEAKVVAKGRRKCHFFWKFRRVEADC